MNPAEKTLSVFNIQRYAIHDGDGIRTTVFFKGCPLRCAWCHNPESQRFEPELVFHKERCDGCGRCVSRCPDGAIVSATGSAASAGSMAPAALPEDAGGNPITTDRTRCVGCGGCVKACLSGARELTGKPWAPEEILALVKRDAPFYESSGGGVTLSGGEPLAQDTDALESLLIALREEGLTVTVDTCGHVPWATLARVLPYVDLFLYDVKHADGEAHRLFTGEGNAQILENLARLGEAGARLDVRVPVVRGVNAEAGAMEAIAEAVGTRIRPRRVRLLPYHSTGSGKYDKLGRDYPGVFSAPDASALEDFRELFDARGFHTVIGG
ncbi:MAG: glycyl-radical enzyme activating protein [Clostridiales bacterium]|nr:glycyl-radical enzyme activating protein [Clostridiales bacterium]